MNRRIVLLLCLLLIFTSVKIPVSASTDDDSKSRNYTNWDYPIKPGTEEWASFTKKEDKLRLLQIPDDVLSVMGTEELIRIVLEYPYFVDVYFYNDIATGLICMSKDFNGIQELMKREDALKFIKIVNSKRVYEEIDLYLPSENTLLEALIKVSSEQDLNLDPKMQVEDVKKISRTVQSYIMYTSMGTPVEYYKYDEYPQFVLDSIEQNALNRYPRAILHSGATAKYNCHSFAWYSNLPTNDRWIPYADAYVTDGTATQFSVPYSGLRAYWEGGIHSGVIVIAPYICLSKWGAGPLMEHDNDCPYSGSLTFWYHY